MTITNSSPISTTGGTYYINSLDFDSRLFFTDTGSTKYYILLRNDTDYTRIIQTGVLNGYMDGSVYNYRFDFNNFIKIENQSEPEFELLDSLGSLKFSGNNSSTLTLCIDTTNVLSQNLSAGHLETLVNGEVILKSGHTTSQLVCDNRFEYKFQDKVDDTLILFETKSIVEFEKYFVFTMYGGTIYYNFYQTPTLIMCPTPACTKSSGYDYTVYMLRIPENTYWLGVEGYDENNYRSIALTLVPKCYGFTNYYFWNPDGRFDSIHCTGNNNIVDVITKKGIQVGDKYVYSDIQIQKQIKQNTGFELNQNQVYGLIESPKVLNIIETEDELHKTSIINDTSNWTTTTDWVYNSTNHTWSATNSNYSYLLSPVISTADYGYTFRMKFTSRFDNLQNYVVEIYDTDTLESIDIKYITTVNNEFTFTCPSEVVHFTISFYGLYPTSGNILLNGITLWTGSTSLSDTTKNPYENINLLPNSYINETSDVYGFGLLNNIYLISGQTYTLSANGYISDQSYAANEYMNVVISTTGGWDEQLSIYSSIPTTKSVTFNAPSSGYYQIQTYPSISSAVGEVHIEWYKLELGNESTPYTGSIYEYIPTSKLYNIDTTTFEGYNGLKLPEKNIELKLTDTKIYKRKTNNKITFFD